MSYNHRPPQSSSPSPSPDPEAHLHATSRRRMVIPSTSSTSSLTASIMNMSINRSHNGYGYHSGRSRGRSPTPSVTSISDEEGDDDMEFDPTRMVAWTRSKDKSKAQGGNVKGKGKAGTDSGNVSSEGLAGSLPPEILVHIFRLLSSNRDLLSVLQVSRTWCLSAYSLLWYKPTLTSARQLAHLTRIVRLSETSLPYSSSIRRLHLTNLAGDLNDHLINGLELCTRVSRLSMGGADRLSTQAIKKLVAGMPELGAIDFSSMSGVEDQVLITIAESCEKLQVLNVGGCKGVGDEGMKAIAKRKMFKRLKVGQCHRLTDRSMVLIAQCCPALLELDLSQVPQITNATLFAIFLHSSYLRELRINGNTNLTDDGIPNLADLMDQIEDDPEPDIESIPWYAKLNGIRSIPAAVTFDHLRMVDFTGCSALTDLAVDRLVTIAPKLRNVTLAKCTGLTDAAVESIARLGRHLHYVHLGHVNSITDAAVTKLARSCTRIRYVDIACCPELTDLSVFELAANLPKVRRIGLVKVTKLTDEAIFALVDRHASLERLHLSYCENVTVKAITYLLNRLLRLTHLSLTGVSAFKVPELQQFCRPTPEDFSEHQRESFCVYSGHGITSLRNYLNAKIAATTATSDDGSTRRGSGSSTSSITIPGAYSPPLYLTQRMEAPGVFGSDSARSRESSRRASHDDRITRTSTSHFATHPHQQGQQARHAGTNEQARHSSGTGRTPVHAPVFRFATRPASPYVSESTVPGLPGAVFTSSAPNFLAPDGVLHRPTRGSISAPGQPPTSAPPGVPVPGPQGLVGYPMTGDLREGRIRDRPRGPRSGRSREAPTEVAQDGWDGNWITRGRDDGAGEEGGGGGGGNEAAPEAGSSPLRWMANTFGWTGQGHNQQQHQQR